MCSFKIIVLFLCSSDDIDSKKEIKMFENKDWDEITTPINVPELKKLLTLSGYDKEKSRKLIEGFTNGFSIGYQGPMNRADMSDNLPLKNIGTKTDLWNKVMKEVEVKRYAGPFRRNELPFSNFIQSPIGLVPKAGGQTRLIFHLSYDFKNGNRSVNAETPTELCSVKYRDLDHAVRNCLLLLQEANKIASDNMIAVIYYSKTDLKSAFRILPVLILHHRWLLMSVIHPETGERFFFIEKCLPFGTSISCALFQEFSNALHHITEYLIKKKNRLTDYLDDFLFISLLKKECNWILEQFLELCKRINCPVSLEKTEYATDQITFLGFC